MKENAKADEPAQTQPPLTLQEFGGMSGVYLGSGCHNGVLTEVYVDFGPDGHLIDHHYVEVGSC